MFFVPCIVTQNSNVNQQLHNFQINVLIQFICWFTFHNIFVYSTDIFLLGNNLHVFYRSHYVGFFVRTGLLLVAQNSSEKRGC